MYPGSGAKYATIDLLTLLSRNAKYLMYCIECVETVKFFNTKHDFSDKDAR